MARSILKIIKEMRTAPPTKSDDPRFDELEDLAMLDGEEEVDAEGEEEILEDEEDPALDDDKFLADLMGEGEEEEVEEEEEELVAPLNPKKNSKMAGMKKMPSSRGKSYLA